MRKKLKKNCVTFVSIVTVSLVFLIFTQTDSAQVTINNPIPAATPAKSGLSYDQLTDRATASINNKNYDSGIADLTEAIALDSNPFLAYLARGRAFYEQKKYDLAIADETAALELNSANKQFAYYLRALAYYARKPDDAETALADLNEALKLDSRYSNALTERGYVYQKLKMWQQAADDYSQVPFAARDVAFFIRLSEVFDNLNDIYRAVADAYAAVKLEPANPKAVQNYQALLGKVPENDRLLKVKNFYLDYDDSTDRYNVINNAIARDNVFTCDQLSNMHTIYRKISLSEYMNIGLIIEEKDRIKLENDFKIFDENDEKLMAKNKREGCSVLY